jgi:hypothetical protein
MLGLIIAFLPWIILAVLGNRWFELALALALAAAAVTMVRQIPQPIAEAPGRGHLRLLRLRCRRRARLRLDDSHDLYDAARQSDADDDRLGIIAGRRAFHHLIRARAGPTGTLAFACLHSDQSIHRRGLGRRLFPVRAGFPLSPCNGRYELRVTIRLGSLFSGRGCLHGVFPGMVPSPGAATGGLGDSPLERLGFGALVKPLESGEQHELPHL